MVRLLRVAGVRLQCSRVARVVMRHALGVTVKGGLLCLPFHVLVLVYGLVPFHCAYSQSLLCQGHRERRQQF